MTPRKAKDILQNSRNYGFEAILQAKEVAIEALDAMEAIKFAQAANGFIDIGFVINEILEMHYEDWIQQINEEHKKICQNEYDKGFKDGAENALKGIDYSNTINKKEAEDAIKKLYSYNDNTELYNNAINNCYLAIHNLENKKM